MTNKKIIIKAARIIRKIYGCSLGQSKQAAKRFMKNQNIKFNSMMDWYFSREYFYFDFEWDNESSGYFINPGNHVGNVPFPDELVLLKQAFKKYPGNTIKNELRDRNLPITFDKCIHIDKNGRVALRTMDNPDNIFCTLCKSTFVLKEI